jgi:hypothetical protein
MRALASGGIANLSMDAKSAAPHMPTAWMGDVTNGTRSNGRQSNKFLGVFEEFFQ